MFLFSDSVLLRFSSKSDSWDSRPYKYCVLCKMLSFHRCLQRRDQSVAIKVITKKNLSKAQNLLTKEINILKVCLMYFCQDIKITPPGILSIMRQYRMLRNIINNALSAQTLADLHACNTACSPYPDLSRAMPQYRCPSAINNQIIQAILNIFHQFIMQIKHYRLYCALQ